MNVATTAVLALLLWTVCAAPLQGQRVLRVGIGGGAGYYTLHGDDFRNVGDAPGLEGVLRVSLLDRLQLGAGVHWSRHELELLQSDLSVIVAFAEPRLTFARESPRVAPFLAGRLGYALQRAEIDTQAGRIEADAAGYLLGGIGGLEFPLSGSVALEASGSYYWLSLREGEIRGLPISLPEARGHALGIRAGLNVYF